MLKLIIKQLLKEDFYHKLGRFILIRRAYSILQSQRQRSNQAFHKQRLKIRDQSIFDGVQVETGVEQIRQAGVTFGLHLPAPLIEQIYQYASQASCTEPGFGGEFMVEEVKNGRLRGKRRVLRALVSDVTSCEVIDQIVQDPALLQIVQGYLHYWPTRITRHLVWSFVSDLPEKEQRHSYRPLSYHYDVAGYNFMLAHFYITDVDAYSGAHVMIKKSHNKRPLLWEFSGVVYLTVLCLIITVKKTKS